MTKRIKVSVAIITLGRDSLYHLLQILSNQKTPFKYEIILILQGTFKHEQLEQTNITEMTLKIFNYPKNKGFGYYRNEAIRKSNGEIIVFIDDDEWPENELWLQSIANPIITGSSEVATAGTKIPITRNKNTNAISLLGFPGGGNLGFQNVWSVRKDGLTDHICSGNFAFRKNINIYFNEQLRSGAEDVDFARRLCAKNFKIKWVPQATVFHQPRSGGKSFWNWHLQRGKSIYEYSRTGAVMNRHFFDRIKLTKKIFSISYRKRLLFRAAYFLIVQYMATFWGYIIGRYFHAQK